MKKIEVVLSDYKPNWAIFFNMIRPTYTLKKEPFIQKMITQAKNEGYGKYYKSHSQQYREWLSSII